MAHYRILEGNWLRPALQFVVGGVLALCIYWNLSGFGFSMRSLPPRESDSIVAWENQFLPEIRDTLIRESYRHGYIGYMTLRSLNGERSSARDDIHWAQLRYVTIPFILVRDVPDTPYVLGDFTEGDPVPEAPQGLIKLHDSGKGLVLYKRIPSP